MKTKNLFLPAFVLLAFFACKNDESTTTSGVTALKSGELVSNDITVESVLNEANYEAEVFSQSEKWLRELAHIKKGRHNIFDGKNCDRYSDGTFPTVSIDTAETGYPITITIDYGEGTILLHGDTISGVVTIEITAEKHTDGAQRIITYTNCKIDSVLVNGTDTELFNGDNETSAKTTVTSEVVFDLDNGTKLTRKGTTVHEWLEGLSTPMERSDDKIQKTGSVSIFSSTGDEWVKSIKEPLIRLGDCHQNVQGIVEYNLNSSTVATLDYGDGTCDNTALLTVGDNEIEITFQNHEGKLEMGKPNKRKGK